MSCTYHRGVVLCQTEPLGALLALIAIALLIVVAYQAGRNRRLRDVLGR